MDLKETYIVSNSWWEEYSPILVRGPKVDDWKEFCFEVLQKAAKKCLQSNERKKFHDFICAYNLKESLIKELVKLGYKVMQPEEFTIYGGIIGGDETVKGKALDCDDEIKEYNQKVSDELHKAVDKELKVRDSDHD